MNVIYNDILVCNESSDLSFENLEINNERLYVNFDFRSGESPKYIIGEANAVVIENKLFADITIFNDECLRDFKGNLIIDINTLIPCGAFLRRRITNDKAEKETHWRFKNFNKLCEISLCRSNIDDNIKSLKKQLELRGEEVPVYPKQIIVNQ